MLAKIALRSLANRWPTALLSVLAIAMSVALVIGVEKARNGAKQSFADTISGAHLIMGARAGSIQLLLYSVFRIGDATANITYETYLEIASAPEIAWIAPLSLGDSHRGFRVLGTNDAYFEHYRYRDDQPLRFRAGGRFADLYDAVVGADVAASLGYAIGDPAVIAHGLGAASFIEHDDKPFVIVGILEKTGTPVDRTVHVSLEAIEAIHVDWRSGARIPGRAISADEARAMDLAPKAVTAALIGLRSPLDAFALQRFINTYPDEALSAIFPGVALTELWSLIGVAETALKGVSFMVVLTAIIGMVAMILASLAERRREMAILRAVGATPATIALLLVAEALILVVLGAVLGVALAYGALLILRPLVDDWYGLSIAMDPPGARELWTLFAVFAFGALAGLLPAARAYRQSVADGLTVKS